MLITLVDDSIPFNASSPLVEPLGSAERAFASLPAALAKRGHVVRAVSRASVMVAIDNVSWLPWEGKRPRITEVLVAYRKPSLLDFVRATRRKILWLTRPAAFLARAPAHDVVSRTEAHLVFLGQTHRATYTGEVPGMAKIIPFGVRQEYLECGPMEPVNPPTAVVTIHPVNGLAWLVQLWVDRIHPALPEAELHVFSASLAAAQRGAEIAEPLRPVSDLVRGARAKGVRVLDPRPDPAMAEAYRTARVHLYPSAEGEIHCSTLADSQACGLPAVARPLGAAAERLIDGETGFLAADDEEFAGRSIKMLSDENAFQKISGEARLRQRRRSWDKVAGEFEVLFR